MSENKKAPPKPPEYTLTREQVRLVAEIMRQRPTVSYEEVVAEMLAAGF